MKNTETPNSNHKQPPEVFYVKKVFLEISQNSQENTCARVCFLIKLQAWGEHHWTAASEQFYTDTPTNEKNWVEKLKIDHCNIM